MYFTDPQMRQVTESLRSLDNSARCRLFLLFSYLFVDTLRDLALPKPLFALLVLFTENP